ncbi:hypothetical protein [Christiangramia echinicola]|uniref:hypothetical protein n=1 Tax=Christiangramia echinicola TaxID=279359 RepID=UPI0004236B0E|nr:hypothetical protein [Christiangramia echinicola]
MKSIIRNSGLLLIIILFSANINAQKKIELMLIVKTDSITQNNIAETCRFEGQPADTNIEDFVTEVSLNDEVKWKADQAENNDAKVKLVKFQHDSGTKLFNKDSIQMKNGRIKGDIVNGNANEEEKYSLVIRVKDSNNDWQEYTIDPKLKLTQ